MTWRRTSGSGKGLLRNDNSETAMVNVSLCIGGPGFDPAASS